MKSLVIVESPTKARTISRYLGSEYLIKASMGHVMDLPKSTLGVDVEHDFKPDYQQMPDKKKIIDELKKSAKEADKIILATDPDREGEAIAAHVLELLTKDAKKKVSRNSQNNSRFSRVARIVFHEITEEAIKEALENPRSIDSHLVDAQTARRVLDRLVGYKLSPLLWKKVRRGLSAGRVQSVALRLIVEREKEIEKFKKEEYWTIKAFFAGAEVGGKNFLGPQMEKVSGEHKDVGHSADSENFTFSSHQQGTEFELIEISGDPSINSGQGKIETQQTFNLYDGEYRVSKTIIENEKKAKDIEEDLKTKKYQVAEVEKKPVFRYPQPPYTTSTLQQDGARRLGFPGRKTMAVAQKLYEEGLITYHRTDSVKLSILAINAMRAFIKKDVGEKYLPGTPKFYKTKQKLAQEAHEAIRPTRFFEISNLKSQISKLGRDHFKLYEMIWRRAVACQMKEAEIESTTVIVDSVGDSASLARDAGPAARSSQGAPASLANASNADARLGSPSLASPALDSPRPKYRLKTNGSVLIFDGFLKINPQALQDKKLPDFKALEPVVLLSTLAEKKETPPPPRYNDASLIATLEEKGIGRPSTYAAIISTIESRRYIERSEGRFLPTPVGVAVNDFLVKNFSDIDDIPFTAEMEDHLDSVADGKKDWVLMMKDFYKPFAKELDKAEDVKRVKIEVEKTDEKCPECGAPLIVRIGRFGRFLACSKFPECKFTKQFVEETNFDCPKCGSKIIIKRTRRGHKFYGCSNYPKCHFAAWKTEDIKII